jgi:nucleotide-binding universal stress UspA family protein
MITGLKTLFLPFSATREGAAPASVGLALALAGAAGAHPVLRALALHIESTGGLAPRFVGSLLAGVNEEEAKRARSALAEAEEALRRGGHPIDAGLWEAGTTTLLADAVRHARSADLSIVDEASDDLMPSRALIEELVFHSGRPVLVVPRGAGPLALDRVAVGWDGSQRAARALSDALPFLRAAGHVDLVCVTNEKVLAGALPGAEVMPHLLRHGVEADVVELTPTHRDAGRAIAEHVVESKAGLLVMGAYARSWLRQVLFGGVTSAMLEKPPAPLLMSF